MLKSPLALPCLTLSCFLAFGCFFYPKQSAQPTTASSQTNVSEAIDTSFQAEAIEAIASEQSSELETLANSLYQGKIKKGSATDRVLRSLFIEWGTEDPLAAMEYLSGIRQGIQRYSKCVLRGWAQTGRTSDASDWIETHVGPARADPFYEALIHGLNDVDKQTAALELIEQRKEDSHSVLAAHALKLWASRDLASASLWIEQNQSALPESVLAGALSGYASAWAYQSPEQASQWAISLPDGSTKIKALQSAIDVWIQYDAAEATHWLLDQEINKDTLTVLSKTAHLISHVEPQLAFDLIEQDQENRDDPYRLRGHMIMALDNIIHKNPAAAAPWIEQVEAKTQLAAEDGLTHSGYRVPRESYIEMLSRWAAEDETAAFSYLAQAPQLNQTERNEIERSTFERLQSDDPQRAAAILFKRWNDIDQKSATRFSSTLPLDYWETSVSDLKSHYKDIAAEWAKTDPKRISFYLKKQKLLSADETKSLLLAIN